MDRLVWLFGLDSFVGIINIDLGGLGLNLVWLFIIFFI